MPKKKKFLPTPYTLSSKTRIKESYRNYKEKRISWAISTFDYDGPWGIEAVKKENWIKHLTVHISSFETMTWDELLKASGGRAEGKGNNHHEINVDNLSKKAKGRLNEINWIEDTDTIFSLRLQSKIRIYGVRDDNILKILWFDPWHDDKKQCVCSSSHS